MIDRAWLREQLTPDGSVRHIVVDAASLEDWQRLWRALRRHDPAPTYLRAGSEAAMPPSVGPIFTDAPALSRSVLFDWRGTEVDWRLYGSNEADFTINPPDTDHDTAIIGLLGWLGDLLHRPVTLIHENRPDYAILRYDPADGRYTHPPWL
ncbi:hypothetical protein [Sphingomonas panni]|uniref:hypothetical protein n=1 Tax=Sphingomonas panni TaxID=237612 RepID=UPI001F5B27E6|nr:hypothetical protein [Sphingomonas panni]